MFLPLVLIYCVQSSLQDRVINGFSLGSRCLFICVWNSSHDCVSAVRSRSLDIDPSVQGKWNVTMLDKTDSDPKLQTRRAEGRKSTNLLAVMPDLFIPSAAVSHALCVLGQ